MTPRILIEPKHLERRAPHAPAPRGMVTFVAGRRCREICDSPLVRTHAQSRVELESPRARVPYIAGCEISPATVLRADALRSNRTRSRAAYGAGRLTAQHLSQELQRVNPSRDLSEHTAISQKPPITQCGCSTSFLVGPQSRRQSPTRPRRSHEKPTLEY